MVTNPALARERALGVLASTDELLRVSRSQSDQPRAAEWQVPPPASEPAAPRAAAPPAQRMSAVTEADIAAISRGMLSVIVPIIDEKCMLTADCVGKHHGTLKDSTEAALRGHDAQIADLLDLLAGLEARIAALEAGHEV